MPQFSSDTCKVAGCSRAAVIETKYCLVHQSGFVRFEAIVSRLKEEGSKPRKPQRRWWQFWKRQTTPLPGGDDRWIKCPKCGGLAQAGGAYAGFWCASCHKVIPAPSAGAPTVGTGPAKGTSMQARELDELFTRVSLAFAEKGYSTSGIIKLFDGSLTAQCTECGVTISGSAISLAQTSGFIRALGATTVTSLKTRRLMENKCVTETCASTSFNLMWSDPNTRPIFLKATTLPVVQNRTSK